MLWPLILPMQFTAAILAVLVLLVVVLAPKLKRGRGVVLSWALVVATLAFIPSCDGILTALDAVRFGTFRYASFAEVDDPRVERYLPPTATDITLHKHAQGFQAKFHIAEAELDKYLDRLWDKYGDQSINSRADYEKDKQQISQPYLFFDDPNNWPTLTDPVEYESPRAPNGAGFTIWYSKEDGMAYEFAGYW